MKRKSIRRNVFDILESGADKSRKARIVQLAIMLLILLNVLAVTLESVDLLSKRYQLVFFYFEVFSVIVFSVEYVIRLWSCIEDPRWFHPVTGRLRYAFSWLSLIDLLAIIPFYLPALIAFDLRFVRAIRLVRIVRLLKLSRYSQSLQTLVSVFRSKKDELLVTLFVVFVLLVISSSLMYYAEKDAQPQAFASIPNAMWWTVVTLTTVGYGDAYPVTVAGKIIGAIVAVLGIALFAMPTAILGSGFLEEIQKNKEKPQVCPHCGRILD